MLRRNMGARMVALPVASIYGLPARPGRARAAAACLQRSMTVGWRKLCRPSCSFLGHAASDLRAARCLPLSKFKDYDFAAGCQNALFTTVYRVSSHTAIHP